MQWKRLAASISDHSAQSSKWGAKVENVENHTHDAEMGKMKFGRRQIYMNVHEHPHGTRAD